MNHRKFSIVTCIVLLMLHLNTTVWASGTTYTVGVQNLGNPFSYTDAQGKFSGISVDFLGLLAQQGGYTIDVVEITDETQDMDFDFTVLLNDEGMDDTWRSDPYLEVPVVLLEQEYTQTESKRVGMVGYYDLTVEAVQATLNESVELVEYENLQDLIQSFVDGDIYRIMITPTSMTYSQDQLGAVHYLSTPLDLYVDLAITYSADFDVAAAQEINTVIGEISEADLQMSVIRNSAAPEYEPTFMEMMSQHPEYLVALVALILLVILHGELRSKAKLRKMVNRDDLTGLYSKRRFIQLMEQKLTKHPEIEYVLLSMDIDNFKYINEIYGYEKGNQVLMRLSEVMVRDAKSGSLLCRTFADKFLVLAPKDAFENFNRMHNLRNETERFGLFDDLLGEMYAITISVGAYEITDITVPIEAMIDCADLGRSKGKNSGETKVVRFSEDMIQTRSYNSSLVAAMEHGLAAKEFVMYYQPKVNLSTGALYGAEALVRWKKGDAFIQPNDFIPLFEQNGFIQKLDYYVFDAVCTFLEEQVQESMAPLSINLSAVTILKPTVVDDLMEILERHHIKPTQIDIEMTETALVEAHESALEALTQLREYGFTCSMDDFGVGVSSLTRLKTLPIDTLKIDRGLVLGHMENEKGASILRNIFNMAKDLQVHTVAEGVETQEHLEFLIDYDCEIGQGYYFSRPVPEQEFLAMYHAFKTEGKTLMDTSLIKK